MSADDRLTQAAQRAREADNEDLAERLERAVEFGAAGVMLSAADIAVLMPAPAPAVDVADVLREAFNTAHRPTPDFPDLEEVNRHDGHRYDASCWVCQGDVDKLTAHLADTLISLGLIAQPAPKEQQ